MTPPTPADVRLVVADMDGTLLDEHSAIPDSLWPVLRRLRDRGITFAPASGRQYATLAHQFERALDGMVIIAENGSYVLRNGIEVSSITLDRALVMEAIDVLRDYNARGGNIGIVLCGKRSAYIERVDDPFTEQVRDYYLALQEVDDLTAVKDAFLKFAIYDFGDPVTGTAAELARFQDRANVVVSAAHWVDVMAPGANKGAAVQSLQHRLGVSREQTVAFGDYLNDLELIDAAGQSYAMANAHPDIIAHARFLAPSNTEHGVITVLDEILSRLPDTPAQGS